MSDFLDWEVIDTYSTRQAVEDGFLVLVDQKISKEAGIKYPVYLTRAVWDKYVELPEGFENVLDPDLDGNRNMRLVTLKSIIQAQDFDDPSPAIFIMKPSED